jgi:hypothetical protein
VDHSVAKGDVMSLTCGLSDLSVNHCACRLHGRPEPRSRAGEGSGRDGYPAAGAAALLAVADDSHITEPDFNRTLTRIREAVATSRRCARHLNSTASQEASYGDSLLQVSWRTQDQQPAGI